MLEYVPQPNTNAGPFFQNNYFVVTPQVDKANGFIVSVDHSFLKKNRVTVRINKSDGRNVNSPNFRTIANSNNPGVLVLSRGLRVEHVYTASPTSVNTMRFQADSQPNRNLSQLDATGRPLARYQFFSGGGNGSNYVNLGQNSRSHATRITTSPLSIRIRNVGSRIASPLNSTCCSVGSIVFGRNFPKAVSTSTRGTRDYRVS